jgi:cytosine/adenosine deaminase-related metal-dependent hydrolase
MDTMKYLIAVAIVAVVVAGCVRPAATPQATVTVTEEARAPIPERATNDDDLYLSLLASEGIRAPRQASVDAGKSICDALDKGFDKSVLALLAVDAGFTEREAAALVAAAVVVYCPRHKS